MTKSLYFPLNKQMFKTTIITTLFCVGLSAFWMRYSHLLVRGLSIMAKEVKVEPYSMAFVTAPNKEVAKTNSM